VDDLAQYSPLRRPKRRFAEPEPFRYQTPLVFRPAPVVELDRERRASQPYDCLRARG
jgi:hypothetical protein